MFLATPRNAMLKARPCRLGRETGRWFSSSTPRCKQRLVVLGSGWGGYNILRGVDKKRWGESEAQSLNFFLNWTQTRCHHPVTKYLFQLHAFACKYGRWNLGIQMRGRTS